MTADDAKKAVAWDVAEHLATAHGAKIFPLKPDKKPRTPHGLYEATSDPKKIAEWRRQWPHAPYGIRTGPRKETEVRPCPKHQKVIGGRKHWCNPGGMIVDEGGSGFDGLDLDPGGRESRPAF